jgi:dihydrofolate reductase
MVMVTTLDGKITKGDDPHIHQWTSKEDQEYFSSLIKSNNLLVFGSQTYEAAKNRMHLSQGKLRVVLTRNPEKYKRDSVPGQLEFSNESPRQLVARLRKKGYKTLLLLGGGVVNALFLRAGLVDELHLTLEPKIFGRGKALVNEEVNVSLKLTSVKKLNSQGTLLLKYRVLKRRNFQGV